MLLPVRGWLVTGIISLSSTAALAADTKTPFAPCTTAPTEGDRKAAQGAFAAGQGSFNEADYATAITYWRDAYRRDCTAHALLLNLARAYELKTDRSEAVNALETYLQRKPDAPDADQIRRRIDNLKSQMAAAAPAPVPTAAPAPTPVPTAAPAPGADSGGKGHGPGVAPLVVGGVGVVAGVIGAIVFAGGAKKVSDTEVICPDRKCPKGQEDQINVGNDGRKQETIGGVVLGIGIAAAVGGVVWYVLASSSGSSSGQAPAPRRATVEPAFGPGFAGLSIAGRF